MAWEYYCVSGLTDEELSMFEFDGEGLKRWAAGWVVSVVASGSFKFPYSLSCLKIDAGCSDIGLMAENIFVSLQVV